MGREHRTRVFWVAALITIAASGAAVILLPARYGWAEASAVVTVIVLPTTVIGFWLSVRAELGPAVGGPAEPSPPWAPPPLPLLTVDRADLEEELGRELAHAAEGSGRRLVALVGLPGFGKTTVATQLCHRDDVRRLFRGGLAWTTLGQHVWGASLAEHLHDLCRQISGDQSDVHESGDVEEASRRLSGLLAARPTSLLVVDDVWDERQLAPFNITIGRHVVLVTSRNPAVVPPDGRQIRVEVFSTQQAHDVLVTSVAGLSSTVSASLQDATGRWPVLLALVAAQLRERVGLGADMAQAAATIETKLRAGGPTALDSEGRVLGPDPAWSRVHPLFGAADREAGGPQGRAAVAATVRASLDLLPPDSEERYLELGIFRGPVPRDEIAAYWRMTGGLDDAGTDRLCADLYRLALVQLGAGGDGTLRLHDVLRDYVLQAVGARATALHERYLASARARLPTDGLDESGSDATGLPRWWALPPTSRYLWLNVAYHLRAAGRHAELVSLLRDLRFVMAKLTLVGVGPLESDFVLADDSQLESLRRAVGRAAHLLGPLEPRHAMAATLTSRLSRQPELAVQVADYWAHAPVPRFASRLPMPDEPHPAQVRMFRAQAAPLAASSTGAWLATSGGPFLLDGAVSIWSLRDGAPLHSLDDGTSVLSIGVDAAGRWLAALAADALQIWNPRDGSAWQRLSFEETEAAARSRWRRRREGSTRPEYDSDYNPIRPGQVAAPRDLSWVACAVHEWSWIWHVATNRCHQISEPGRLPFSLRVGGPGRGSGWVTALAAAPDGSWLASAAEDGAVRIWDPATGMLRHELSGHRGLVFACQAAPDSSWLATAGTDGAIRIWDPRSGRARTEPMIGHTDYIETLAVSPDGSWLASGGDDATVRVWNVASGRQRHVLAGHTDFIRALAVAPDGSWLASAGDDRAVRVWDPASGASRVTLIGHTAAVSQLVPLADGTRLASANFPAGQVVAGGPVPAEAEPGEATVRIWDVPTGPGTGDGHADGHEGGAAAGLAAAVLVTVQPAHDGRWVVTAGLQGTTAGWDADSGARMWNRRRGRDRRPPRIAVAPDGAWLAVSGDGDAVHVLDSRTGATIRTFHTRNYGTAHLVPVGRTGLLAVGDPYGATEIWNPVTGRREGTVGRRRGDDLGGPAMVIPPDGGWLADADRRGGLRVVSLATGRARTLRTGGGPVQTLLAAPDGRWLAAVSDDLLSVWDPAGGQLVGKVSRGQPELSTGSMADRLRRGSDRRSRFHTAAVAAADGAWIAVASRSGGVEIYDPCQAIRRAVLTGHDGPVIALDRAGSTLISVSSDATVRAWRPDTREAVTALRVAEPLFACCSLGPNRGVAVVGKGGLYFLELITAGNS